MIVSVLFGSHAGYLWMYQDDYEQSVKSKEIT